MLTRLLLLALIAAPLALPPYGPVRAEDGVMGEDDDDHDHDRAHELLEQGEIHPLREIIARVARDYPGEVVGVSLSRNDGHWVYDFKILTPEGRVLALTVDAESLDVLGDED